MLNRYLDMHSETQRITDAYARRSISVPEGYYSAFNLSNLLLKQEVERKLVKVVGRRTSKCLRQTRILEVGCGSGYWLRQFIQWGAQPENLAGIDLLADRIAEAKKLCPAAVRLQCGEASRSDFSSGSFHIVFQATAFTSIVADEMKSAVAREMLRVLRSDGFVLWYDFFVNNPRNPDVRGIGKDEIHRLFPNCRIRFERTTLAPPIGRLLGRVSELAYSLASGLRFACTHYVAVIEKENGKAELMT